MLSWPTILLSEQKFYIYSINLQVTSEQKLSMFIFLQFDEQNISLVSKYEIEDEAWPLKI